MEEADDSRIFNLWMSQYHLVTIRVLMNAGVFKTLGQKGPMTTQQLATSLSLFLQPLSEALEIAFNFDLLKFSFAPEPLQENPKPHAEKEKEKEKEKEEPFFPSEPTNKIWSLSPTAKKFLVETSPCFWGAMFCDEFGLNTPSLEALMRTGEPQWQPLKAWETADGSLSLERVRQIAAGMHAHSVGAARYLGPVFRHLIDLPSDPKIIFDSDSKNQKSLCKKEKEPKKETEKEFEKEKEKEKKDFWILDVAGGSGCYSTEICRHNPYMRATVLELPTSAAVTREYHDREKDKTLRSRLQVVEADMFRDSWPSGAKVVFFSEIWHDWNDDQCLQLARLARAAGQMIVLNEILKAPADPEGEDNLLDHEGRILPHVFSLHMMFCTRGRQRSLGEFSQLLKAAGFSHVSCVYRYFGHWSLVTAF